MASVALETHVAEFIKSNKVLSASSVVTLTASLVAQVSLKSMSLDEKKKSICDVLDRAIKNTSGLPVEEVTGLIYVVKNVVPPLVDLLGTFDMNALETKAKKEVEKVASSYWASCMSYIPVAFRGQVSTVIAQAIPVLEKKAEELAGPVAAAAVAAVEKPVEAVAGVAAAEAVADAVADAAKKVEAVVADAVAVVASPEVVVSIDAAAVPDWTGSSVKPVVDLSGSTVSSNPV